VRDGFEDFVRADEIVNAGGVSFVTLYSLGAPEHESDRAQGMSPAESF